MNGTLSVARYTLIELSRRRILLVFFVIGALGIAAIGISLKTISVASPISVPFGGANGSTPPDPAKMSRLLDLQFVTQLNSVVGVFALLIAFAIGMTVIYHDLDSGAAVSIFSKPVSRLAFTAGKLFAALVGMIVVVGLLSLEVTMVTILFGGGLEEALWVETAAGVGNAVLLMLIVLTLSTWMDNIVAAIVAFIYNFAATFVVGLHDQWVAGLLGDNGIVNTTLGILYWLVPHHLASDAQRQLTQVELDLYPSSSGGLSSEQILSAVPAASGIQDILWWVFLVALMATMCYLVVRRRQV